MSESRSYRHTSGDWAKHPAYQFVPMVQVEDDGNAYVFCHVYLASGEKIIAQVEMSTSKDAGFPHVDNLIEMKANLALMSAAPNLLESQTMGSDMTTPEMLDWVADRLISKGDHPGNDFIISLRERAEAGRKAIAKATTY